MPPKMRAKRAIYATLKDRILSDIETKIFSGRWPPGHRIPNEHELAEKYRCSRMTVNKVLTDLAMKGILERRRKAGTFVGKPTVQSAVLRIPDIKAEVEGLGYLYRYELLFLKRRQATNADQALMQLSPEHSVIEFRCVHWANKQPFAYEHRFLNVTAVPQALEQNFDIEPPGTWLLNHVPWTEAEHNIFAEAADIEAAQSLRVAKILPAWWFSAALGAAVRRSRTSGRCFKALFTGSKPTSRRPTIDGVRSLGGLQLFHAFEQELIGVQHPHLHDVVFLDAALLKFAEKFAQRIADCRREDLSHV